MRAISVKQPFAEAIASGRKRVEYRSWRAPSLVGHDLLIVASKGVMVGYRGEPKGVAVCVVRVTAMRGSPGDYGWCVTDPRRVKPLPVRGYQGLYRVHGGAIRYVR